MIEEMMTTLNDLNGYLDDEAYTVRVGELRRLLATPAPLSDEPVAHNWKTIGVEGEMANPSDKQEAMTKTQANDLITAYARGLVSKNHSAVYAAYEALMNALIAAPLTNPSDKQEAKPVAWKTTRKAICVQITENRETAKLWRWYGYDVTPLYAAPPAQPAEQSAVVDDLRMLVQRLVHALNKASPDNDLGAKALDYFVRKGLTGSILRDDKSAEQDRIDAVKALQSARHAVYSASTLDEAFNSVQKLIDAAIASSHRAKGASN